MRRRECRVEKLREASIVAKTDCEVAEIGYDKFYELKDDFPEILYAIGAQMAERLSHTTKKLHDLAFVDAKGRTRQSRDGIIEEPRQVDPIPGRDLRLTIDADIQKAMVKAMQHETFANYLKGAGLTVEDSVAGHEEWTAHIKAEYEIAEQALKDLGLLK